MSGNILLGQKLANTCRFEGGPNIVQQEKPIWTNPLNALQ